MDHLKHAGIGTGIHYPIPLHLQKAYVHLNYSPGDFPVAERVATEIVSLPMYRQLTEGQQATGQGAAYISAGIWLGARSRGREATRAGKKFEIVTT